MPSSWTLSHCRDKVLAIAQADLDDGTLRREVMAELRCGIGFATWGWPLSDPGSLLSTIGFADPAIWAAVPAIVSHQERYSDLLSDRDLAAGPPSRCHAEQGGSQ